MKYLVAGADDAGLPGAGSHGLWNERHDRLSLPEPVRGAASEQPRLPEAVHRAAGENSAFPR